MDVTTNFGTVKIKLLKGDTGAQGIQGEQGIQGVQGEPFEFEDFTEAQLAELRADVATVYYRKLEETVYTSGTDTSTIAIPFEDYSGTTDMLFVNVEGLLLAEGVDYTISGTNILLTEPISHHYTAVNFMMLTAIAMSVEDFDNLTGDIETAIETAVDAWLVANPDATTTIEDGSVTEVKLADSAVTETKIADGTITDAKLVQSGGVLDDVASLEDSTEYLRKLVTNIDSLDVLSGKYASFSGTTVGLYNVANSGCIKIPVSDYVGQMFYVSAESLNATYNVCYVIADASSTFLGVLKITGVTTYDRVQVQIPSNAAYLYINFDYTDGTVKASAERLVRDEPSIGTIQSAYPLITFDSIGRTLEISNALNNAYFPVYLSYWNTNRTLSNGSTAISQTFSDVYTGTLYFDLNTLSFVYQSSFVASDTTNYLVIARFMTGAVTESHAAIRTIANENKHGKKRIMCYGDSLTWYDGQAATWGPDQGTTIVGFESYLRAYLHMSVGNAGRSGETIPQICARMAADSSARSCDMLMLMGGDNDDRQGVTVGTLLPQGSSFDTTTTIGAMQNAIESVLADNPTCVLFLATEPMGWKWNGTALERVDDVYPNAIRRVAELYGLPLLDLWKISGVNELTRNTMYLDPPDTTNQQYMYHPNNYGWKVISERIIQFIQTL